MARPKMYRKPSAIVLEDRAILNAVATLPDYTPANPAYAPDAIQQINARLAAAEQAEAEAQRNLVRVQNDLERARQQRDMTARELHTAITGLKFHVLAQYGNDSPVMHMIGMKRRSEYKRPARRDKPE